MKGVINYCCRRDKTVLDENTRLLTGIDCTAGSAYREFMLTKEAFGKASGRYFYQYVQSFSPKENITPQQAHAVGVELAKQWPGHEILVATHIDAGHLHNHFVINSVSFEDGHKLRQDKETLKRLRKASDDICVRHGFLVLKPYEKSEKKGLSSREYRAAVKGESWKFKLMNTINQAMNRSRTREDFIKNMNARGYGVRWEDSRQSITYTCPNKMKCRDNRLHDQKYLKGNMENEFTIRTISREPRRPRGKKRGQFCRTGRRNETLYGNSSQRSVGRDEVFIAAGDSVSADAIEGFGRVGDTCGAHGFAGAAEGIGNLRDAGIGENYDRPVPDADDQNREYRTGTPETTVTGWEESREIFYGFEKGFRGSSQFPADQTAEKLESPQAGGADIVSVAVGAGAMVAAAMMSDNKPVKDSTRKRYSVSSAATKRKKQAQGIYESDEEEQTDGPVLSM